MSKKKYRDAGEGEYVSREYAEANPLTTLAETVNSNANAAKFLKRLAENGGAIISSNDLSPEEIEAARQEKRMFVDDDGLGYIYEPIEE